MGHSYWALVCHRQWQGGLCKTCLFEGDGLSEGLTLCAHGHIVRDIAERVAQEGRATRSPCSRDGVGPIGQDGLDAWLEVQTCRRRSTTQAYVDRL